ncbi:hypothetical protein D3C87_1786310 [compost metagenome]
MFGQLMDGIRITCHDDSAHLARLGLEAKDPRLTGDWRKRYDERAISDCLDQGGSCLQRRHLVGAV